MKTGNVVLRNSILKQPITYKDVNEEYPSCKKVIEKAKELNYDSSFAEEIAAVYLWFSLLDRSEREEIETKLLKSALSYL